VRRARGFKLDVGKRGTGYPNTVRTHTGTPGTRMTTRLHVLYYNPADRFIPAPPDTPWIPPKEK